MPVTDPKTEFKAFIESTQQNLEPYLKASLHTRFQTLRRINGKLCDEVRNALTSFCTGGKAVRATLVELGHVIADGKEGDDRLYPIQLSVELTHAALLIHDDIVDHSEMRRNKATLHCLFANGHRATKLRGESGDYGRSVAMLVGDVALCLAHYFALDSNFETRNKIFALSSFIDNLVVTGLGQVMDLQLSASPVRVTPEEIIGMTEYKTAYYTVVAPMQLGALLAECSDLLLNNIIGFGSPLGIAYQLKDDILGLYGDEQLVGKPNSSDLFEGKQTLLMKYGLDRARGTDRSFLKSSLRSKKVSTATVMQVRQILTDCGAREEVETTARKLKEDAIQAIPSLTRNKRYQAVLRGLCEFMVDRDR